MRLKKLVALATATAMLAASSLTAFAAANVGSSDVTVEGEVATTETIIYKVTLPTSSSMEFYFDPLGLYGYYLVEANAGKTPTQSELETGNFTGKIVSAAPTEISNLSSVPILVSATLSITKPDNGGALSELKTKTAYDATGGSTGSFYAQLVPMKDDDGWKAVTAVAEDISGTAAVIARFGVAEADYVYSNTNGTYKYQLAADATAEKIAFEIAGEMDAAADWKDLEAELNCVFTYDGIDDAATQNPVGALGSPWTVALDTVDGNGTGVLDSGNADKIVTFATTRGTTETAPSIAQAQYAAPAQASAGLQVTINWGGGALAAKEVTKVVTTWPGVTAGVTLVKGTAYSVTGSTLTFTKSMLDPYYTTAGAFPATITVTFDTGDTATFKLVANT